MKVLDVYYKDTLAGRLKREEDGTFYFQYEVDYLTCDLPGFPLAYQNEQMYLSQTGSLPSLTGLFLKAGY